MRFGNTTEQLRKGLVAGLVIGVVAYVCGGAMLIFYEKLPLNRLIPLTFILVLPAFAMGLAIVPTLLFSIHIVGEWVEHRMFDRWILSRARASDFIRMQSPSGLFAAVLQFRDGTKMRLFGAHLEILAALESQLRLHRIKPEQDAAPNSRPPRLSPGLSEAQIPNSQRHFAVDMKARSMFLLSLILTVGALLMVFEGRGQLNEAFRAWHSGDRELFRHFAHRGAWFLYPAWALAAGAVACLFVSSRRRERAWRWTVVVLLGLFLLFGLAPA